MRYKLLKSVLSWLLATILVFGGISCKKNENANVVSNVKGYTFSLSDRVSYSGTHEFNITDTEVDLIKDGKTDFVLVFPDGTSGVLDEVKGDFLILFKKATGVTLPTKVDLDVVNDWNEEKKYIVIGDTLLTEKAGISKDEYSKEKIKTEGVRIITKGNTQFLLGGDNYGASNAMYSFLEIYFNFDNYHRSGYSLDTGITDVKFKNIDVTDVPDVEHFMGNTVMYGYGRQPEPWDAYALGVETYEQEVSVMDHRMKSHTATGWYGSVHQDFDVDSPKANIHTSMTYLSKDMTYKLPIKNVEIKTTSNMFAESGGAQLCYTGRGDEKTVSDMVDICAEKIIFSLINYPPSTNPLMRLYNLSVLDNFDHCNCAACVEQMALYGSSGLVVRFINRVGDIVHEWLEEQKDENAKYHYAYRDDFVLTMFGYHRELEPPVDAIDNGDGTITYVPKDESVIFRDYTDVWLVSSNSLRLSGMYDSLQGESVSYHFPGWKAVSNGKNKSVYFFNSPLLDTDYPYDGYTTYSSDFWKTMAYYGYCDVYSKHYGKHSKEGTGWLNLLLYLSSKLRWNCELDPNTLIDNYMNGMYYEAADIMKSIYFDQMNYYIDLRARMMDPSRPSKIASKDNFPYTVLEGWINQFEQAKDAISHYETTNPNLYLTLKVRIQIEEVRMLVSSIQFYGSATNRPFSLETLNGYKAIIAEMAEYTPRMYVDSNPLSGYLGG